MNECDDVLLTPAQLLRLLAEVCLVVDELAAENARLREVAQEPDAD